MKKIILLVIGSLVGVGLLGWGLWVLSANQSDSNQTFTTSIPDWKRGAGDPKVTLLEYSDFQCPACGAYEPVLRQLEKDYAGKISFVYRHFPLRQLHKNGVIAARASEAAGSLGKFWEMHDLLFDKQKEWSPSNSPVDVFATYAQSLGIDVEKFRKDIDSTEVIGKVGFDEQEAEKLNLTSTPTFFLNGEKIQNPGSLEDFKKLIDAKLNQ